MKLSAGYLSWDRLPLVLMLCALIIWLVLGIVLIRHAPVGHRLQQVILPAIDGVTYTLGNWALAQETGSRAAEAQHIQLQYDQLSGWAVKNIADQKRVWLDNFVTGESRYLRRWRLAPGDRFSIGTEHFVVQKLDNAAYSLELLHQAIDGLVLGRASFGADDRLATTLPDGCGLDPCSRKWHDSFKQRIKRKFGHDHNERDLFSIGGVANCATRWAIPELPDGSATIVWQSGAFYLAADSGGIVTTVLRNGGSPIAIRDLVYPLTGSGKQVVDATLIIGQTHYRLSTLENHELRVQPITNSAFLTTSDWRDWQDEEATRIQSPPFQIDWSKRTWIGGDLPGITKITEDVSGILLFLCLAIFATPCVFAWNRYRLRGTHWLQETDGKAGANPVHARLVGVYLLLLGFFIAVERTEFDLTLRLQIAWLCWLIATVIIVIRGYHRGISGWIWLLGLTQSAIGSIVLIQLAAGATNSVWLDYAEKHHLGLIGFAVLAGLFAAWVHPKTLYRVWWSVCSGGHAFSFLLGLLALLSVGLFIQWLFGSEYGIFGVQPVELSKFALIVLAAAQGARLQEMKGDVFGYYRANRMTLIKESMTWFIFFFLFTSMVILGVRDFSPIVIFGCFSLTLLWLLLLDSRQPQHRSWAALILQGLITVSVCIFFALLFVKPAFLYRYLTIFPSSDRIQVFWDLNRHLVDGYQVYLSRQLIASGDWLGTNWFGTNGAVMDLPVVESDFIGTFILNRFGYFFGFFVITIQALYGYCLLRIGLNHNAMKGGDYGLRQARWGTMIALCGMAAMLIAHWLIAWCNVVGLLPVMGQPMSWISAGNSHLLGFVLPIFLFALGTAWWQPSVEPQRQSN